MKQSLIGLTTTAAAVALLAVPALAQKSNDLVRLGITEPIQNIDPYFDPKPETGFFSTAAFDTLIYYDDRDGKFKPLLGKAWRRVNATTIEVDLRDDVKWSDGESFDADDVVSMYSWLIDPKTKLRFKRNWAWIKGVEKLSPHKIRVVAKRPFAMDMIRLAKNTSIFPQHIFGKMENKSNFTRDGAVTTGPYRVIQADKNKGVIIERNDAFKHGGDYRKPSNVKRFHGIPIPDKQSQIAQMLTGGLEFMHGLTKDQLDNMASNPKLAVTASQNLVYIYFLLDAKGRSGIEALKNEKVREALHRAVDRDAIAKNLVPGGDAARPIDSLCLRGQVGCDYSNAPPAYDPGVAKKLLADAGVTDLEMTITTTSAARAVAEAVAGYLRKVGVKANINHASFPAYRKLQRTGQLNALINIWSSGGLPDVGSTMSFFFSAGSRDYHGDPVMTEFVKKGEGEIDPVKRKAIYRQAFDRVNEKHYNMVVSSLPAVFLHSKDLTVAKGSLSPFGASALDVNWK